MQNGRNLGEQLFDSQMVIMLDKPTKHPKAVPGGSPERRRNNQKHYKQVVSRQGILVRKVSN